MWVAVSDENDEASALLETAGTVETVDVTDKVLGTVSVDVLVDVPVEVVKVSIEVVVLEAAVSVLDATVSVLVTVSSSQGEVPAIVTVKVAGSVMVTVTVPSRLWRPTAPLSMAVATPKKMAAAATKTRLKIILMTRLFGSGWILCIQSPLVTPKSCACVGR